MLSFKLLHFLPVSRVNLISIMLAALTCSTHAISSLSIDELEIEGLHQFKITYTNSNAPGSNELTLLGCYHTHTFGKLPLPQQRVLEGLIAKRPVLAYEISEFYHTEQLKMYFRILSDLGKMKDIVDEGFFTEFVQKRFSDEKLGPIDDMVCQKFRDILENMQGIELRDATADLDTNDLGYIKNLTELATIQKLPPRLVYDFVLSYLHHTSMDYHIMKLHAQSLGGKASILALDKDSKGACDQALQESAINFDFLKESESRAKILAFYDNDIWRFKEPELESALPKGSLESLKTLCWLSNNDRQEICRSVVSRIIEENIGEGRKLAQQHPEIHQKIRKEYVPVQVSLFGYKSGNWSYSDSQYNATGRNYNWLKENMLQLVSGQKDALAAFGDSHFRGKKPEKGILDFFYDLQGGGSDSDFWIEKLGQDVYARWKNISIQSIERLNKDGVYVSFSKR